MRDLLDRLLEGVMSSDVVRRRLRPRRAEVGVRNGSRRRGGTFSLLLSPSSMVNEDLKRFADGVDSGVMGSFASTSSKGEREDGSAIA